MARLDYIVMIVTFPPLLYMYYDSATGDVDSCLVHVLSMYDSATGDVD